MAVYRQPSFWDYLGQGVSGFTESLSRAQQMDLLAKQEKRAETMFDYQSAPLEMRKSILESEANPQLGFIPNLMAGIGGTSFQRPEKIFTESQYDFAGVKSPGTRQRERTKADTEQYRTELEIPTLENKATAARASAAGIPADVQRQRVAEMTESVNKFANQYVAQQILQSNGKLDGKNLATMAANAYGAFTANPARLTELGVEGMSTATLRPAFDEAVKNAWDKQRGLDIDALRAQAYSTGQVRDNTPQLMNALTNMAKQFESRVKQMTDDPLNMGRLMPDSPEGRAFAQKVASEQSISNTLMAASAGMAAGTVTPEQAQLLLNQAGQMIMGQSMGGPTVAPEQQQMFDDAAIVAEAQKYGPARWRSMLQKEVTLGRLSQDQVNRVLKLLERR